MGRDDHAAGARDVAAKAHSVRPGRLGEPIRVISPTGALEDWVVPVLQGTQVIGFYQLTSELRIKRFSELADPNAFTINLHDVLLAAQRALDPSERPGIPFLSYDGNPDRLAWAVPVDGPSGPATIFIAGGVAWRGYSRPGTN